METRSQLDPEVIERLEEQSGLLLRTYQAQFAKDPTSHATESSRSNLIALRHTISQISGESTALDVTNALEFASAHLGQLIANAEK
jgi:hypothetical protein